MSIKRKIILTMFVMLATAAQAQDSSHYASVLWPARAKNSWRVFYSVADRLTSDTRARWRNQLNISYGADSKQQLDVYFPKRVGRSAPIFIYVHGGNFVEGDRAHYGYVAGEFARRGIVTIVPSYRLTRDGHRFPDQIDDLKAVVRWAHLHASSLGARGTGIVIAGHSVGALMAADVGVDRSWMLASEMPRNTIGGIALISGRFRPDDGPIGDAYAPTPALRAAASPIDRVVDPVPQMVVAYGGNEPTRIDPAKEMAAKLTSRGVSTELLELPGDNHSDTAMDAALANSPLFEAILRMVQRPR